MEWPQCRKVFFTHGADALIPDQAAALLGDFDTDKLKR